MATTIAGYAYLKKSNNQCIKATKGYVHIYFKKIDSSSSESRWSTSPYTISNEGYFSFTLEDSKILGITGKYKRGTDKLYICFYMNENNVSDNSRNSLDITHCAFVDFLLQDNDVTLIDVTLEPVRKPKILNYSFPPTELLTKQQYTMSENSEPDYSWKTETCGSKAVSQSQKYMYDLVEIFNGHRMNKTIYSWGEIPDREENNSSSNSYSYNQAGTYTQKIKIREFWTKSFIELSQTVNVRYNQPIPDFTWSPNVIKGKTTVTFTNTTTDIDDRKNIYTYDWIIEDKLLDNTDNTSIYLGKSWDFKPEKSFQSPGTKTIKLRVNWNDGFENRVVEKIHTLNVIPFSVTPNFTWNPVNPESRNTIVTFYNTTIDEDNRVLHCDWIIEDKFEKFNPDNPNYGQSETENRKEYLNKSKDFQPTHKFQTSEPQNVTLNYVYDDGFYERTSTITKQIVPNPGDIEVDFSWNPNIPISRDEEVSFSDTSILRGSTSTRYLNWFISDKFSKFNPNNPDYGNSEPDNSKQFLNKQKSDIIKHKFQKEEPKTIRLDYYYNNGFSDLQKSKEKTIIFNHYTLNIDFDTIDGSRKLYGKNEYKWKNKTIDTNSRIIKEKWTFNDKTFPDFNDNIIIRDNQEKFKEQGFTFQYPSRKPFTAINGDTTENYNKEVTLEITFDNGWEDNVKIFKTKTYEASPYEITNDDIEVEENI